jgi:hypothetical protein
MIENLQEPLGVPSSRLRMCRIPPRKSVHQAVWIRVQVEPKSFQKGGLANAVLADNQVDSPKTFDLELPETLESLNLELLDHRL